MDRKTNFKEKIKRVNNEMTNQNKPFLVVIVGPTASGKTELSIEIAKNSMVK